MHLGHRARHADGTPLRLSPHDCRRAFATEPLNNNTPVHVIATLLGHNGLDTVMIYAKLYPETLVEGYRASMRGLYTEIDDPEALRTPTAAEWAALTASCSRGLVCLGCTHAQPRKSAAPTFRRMIAGHIRALTNARDHGEPAGQLAARELELDRLRNALQRARELDDDAAHALEQPG